jgi:hypothetical protein
LAVDTCSPTAGLALAVCVDRVGNPKAATNAVTERASDVARLGKLRRTGDSND